MLKHGHAETPSDDSGDYQVTKTLMHGRVRDVHTISPYGTAFILPAEAYVVAVTSGNGSHDVVGFGDVPSKRFKTEEPWQYKCGNYLTGANLDFQNGGVLRLTSNDVQELVAPTRISLMTPEVVVTGNMILMGNLTVMGEITTTTVPSYNNHTHPETGTTTGGPN